APGHWKYFNTPRDSFWCCTGTGMENHARYGESIYFHDDSSLWVNLFIASELHWKAKNVRLRQETRFPDEPRTRLTVKAETPVPFALRLRVPHWTEREMTVRVNGESIAVAADASGYLKIERTWADGDRVEVETHLRLWSWPMPDDPTLLTVMYGPLVLAGKLDGEEIPKELVYAENNWFEFPAGKIASAPDIVTEHPDPAAWVEPLPDQPLTFRTKGVGRPHDVTLVPYHRLWNQRYAVYWRVLPEDQWQRREAKRKAREAAEAARQEAFRRRLIDRVVPGDPASEKQHALEGESMAAGPHLNRTWRHAADGWFSYRLKVLPDRPVVLSATYWGSDSGRRTFDILVDGQKIATQTLANNAPDKFFDVEYPVPQNLTQGRQTVTVRFQAQPGSIAGGLFDLMTLRAAE
ncbi:MAG: glycoside hydrolase family 127 protein, partial [Thermoguttaceae bacterium]|nr:glycoside hydrolase family 127 protein [Thermoguttaceae bacterium]